MYLKPETLNNLTILKSEYDEDNNLILTLSDGRVVEVVYCCYGGVSLYEKRDIK